MRQAPQLFRYRGLIWTFAQRDLKTRFKGTVLGWAWSLMVPLASLAMYSVVFGIMFRAQAPNFGNGREPVFAVWLFTGLVAWTFFTNSVTTAIASMSSAATLLKKTFFPSYVPIIGSLIAVGMQTVIEFGLLGVVLALFGNVSLTWLLVPLWGALFYLFTLGLSIVLALGNVYLRDLGQLIAVVLQLLFFASPIFYPLSMVPESYHGVPLRQLIMANPISEFVEAFRSLVYGLAVPPVETWLKLAVATALSLAIGFFAVKRLGPDIGEQV